jgi:hypothetical protein
VLSPGSGSAPSSPGHRHDRQALCESQGRTGVAYRMRRPRVQARGRLHDRRLVERQRTIARMRRTPTGTSLAQSFFDSPTGSSSALTSDQALGDALAAWCGDDLPTCRDHRAFAMFAPTGGLARALGAPPP